MPADAGAGPVFIDQYLREGFGGPARKGRDLFAQGQQKIRYRRCLDDFTPIIIVAKTKTDDTPVCQMAVEVEGSEGQSFKMPDEVDFLLRCDQSGLVGETLR